MEFDDFGNPIAKAQSAPQSAKAFVAGIPLAELCELAQEKLSEALQAANPATDAALILKIYAELKDRKDGKPAQAYTAELKHDFKIEVIRFSDLHPPVDKTLLRPVDNVQVIDNEQ